MSSRSREKQWNCPGVPEFGTARSCMSARLPRGWLRATSTEGHQRHLLSHGWGQRGAGGGSHQPFSLAELIIAFFGSNPLPHTSHRRKVWNKAGKRQGMRCSPSAAPGKYPGLGRRACTDTDVSLESSSESHTERAATSQPPLPPGSHILQPSWIQVGSSRQSTGNSGQALPEMHTQERAKAVGMAGNQGRRVELSQVAHPLLLRCSQ